MRARVQGYSGLEKIDSAYVVNVDSTEYNRVLTRKRNQQKINRMESRIESLESKLDSILNLLQRGIPS